MNIELNEKQIKVIKMCLEQQRNDLSPIDNFYEGKPMEEKIVTEFCYQIDGTLNYIKGVTENGNSTSGN